MESVWLTNSRVRSSLRVVEDLGGWPDLDDAASVQKGDPVGNLAGEPHLVGGHHHGHAGAAQLADQLHHPAYGFRIER